LLVLAAWTNEWHHLYWLDHTPETVGKFAVARPVYGPGFWLHIGYCYSLIAASIILLFHTMLRSTGVYRAQAAVMLFGVLLPWVVNIIDLSQVFGYIYFDTAAMTFAVTGLAFLPGLFRYRLLDLAPVAWFTVVKGMNDPVVVIDPSGRIVELNTAARVLIGCPETEIQGSEAARVFAPWPPLAERLARLTEQGESRFELDGLPPQRPASFDARISTLAEGGYHLGWVLVLRDVTEQKRAADERVQMLRVEAARHEAEAANRAKDRFVATLSHELRTPLAPVLAGVNAMRADPATPPAFRSVLEMIQRNVLVQTRLIDDLLDLARIRRGTLVLNREVVDAHELVNHVVAMCDDDLSQAQLQLVVDLAAKGRHVHADPIRLQQVLWNLVKNAIKFTPRGGRVTVGSRDHTAVGNGAAGTELVIEVSDTGIGIEADALPRIFELAERGEITAATRRFGGLGLGLMLSRSIVAQHGGRLAAASAGVGQGATFTLELPSVPAPAALASAAGRSRDAGAAGGSASRSVKILLVDDNADTLKSLATILRRKGHDVRAALDMATSLRLASEVDFDLLISDIELPDGSGLELMQTIRSHRSVPGIALSGFGSPEDFEQSRSAGFARHLIKPVDFRQLEQAIQELAGRAVAGTLVES
jgi:PAS domain S-box-containing protein